MKLKRGGGSLFWRKASPSVLSLSLSREASPLRKTQRSSLVCVCVSGGKWTTYREMAEDVVDLVALRVSRYVAPCSTLRKRLIGGEGYTHTLEMQLQQLYPRALDKATARHLARHFHAASEFDFLELPPLKRPWTFDDGSATLFFPPHTFFRIKRSLEF